jgi:hypothetical protein
VVALGVGEDVAAATVVTADANVKVGVGVEKDTGGADSGKEVTGGVVEDTTGGTLVVGKPTGTDEEKALGGEVGKLPAPTGGIVNDTTGIPLEIFAVESIVGPTVPTGAPEEGTVTFSAGVEVFVSNGATEGAIVTFVTVGAYVVGA